MKTLSIIAAAVAGVIFIVSIILRLMHADLIAGITSLTFWRVTIVLLLTSILFHLYSRKNS